MSAFGIWKDFKIRNFSRYILAKKILSKTKAVNILVNDKSYI